MINYFKNKKRIDYIVFFIIIGVIIILMRSFQLQYTDNEKYSNKIEGIEIKHHIIRTTRGSILDRNNIILAESILMDTVILSDTKEFFSNISKVKKFCSILNINYEDLVYKLKNRENKKFSYITKGRYISPKTREEIKKLNLKSIYFIKEFKRYYPEGEIFSPLIGMTDIDHIGKMGLEKSFNKELQGKDGKKLVLVDNKGNIVEEIRQVSLPDEGKQLKLTIDARLQYIAYRELKEKVDSINAKSGSVVILDSTTGEILASASYPSYDLNNRKTYAPGKERNRVIIDSIEPASTAKPFLIAAALYSKKIDLDDIINTSPGYLMYGSKKYQDKNDNGKLTPEGILALSSNIGSIKISEKFDKKIYYDFLSYVGAGKMINLNFPSESKGQLNDYNTWRSSDVRSHALGYAFKMTPLQLAKAYSVIANQGLVINPYIIKNKITEKYINQKYKDSFLKIRNMLRSVVETGTAKKAQITGYTVGGKTGTAKVYIGGSSKFKYSDQEHASLFAGIVPVTKPKLVIVVVINNEPKKTMQYGGEVAAPVFQRVGVDALRILNVTPDNISGIENNFLTKSLNNDNYF